MAAESTNHVRNGEREGRVAGIGDRIRQLRQQMGWSQDELCKRLGVAKNTLVRYEKQETYPDVPMFDLICQEFECNPIWLMKGLGDPKGRTVFFSLEQRGPMSLLITTSEPVDFSVQTAPASESPQR